MTVTQMGIPAPTGAVMFLQSIRPIDSSSRLIAAACRFATMSRNVRRARPAVRASESNAGEALFQ